MRVGIDLGTTYSQIAAVDECGKIELLQSSYTYGIPSVFYYDGDNEEIFIGEWAVEHGEYGPDNMVLDVKMKLDQEFVLSDRIFTSKEIVSAIYKTVIDQGIENANGKTFMKINDEVKIDSIVLTCPNKFNEQQRELILHAAAYCNGENAERQPVVAIIKEPVAAAIFYIDYYEKNPNEAMQVNENEAILVYDLGGGTCDIALVQYTPNDQVLFRVIDSDMLSIGGRNWDQKISELLEECFDNEAHVQMTPEIRNKIRKKAEQMKKKLGYNPNQNVIDYLTYSFNNNPRKIRFQLSLEQFQTITKGLLDQTMKCLTDMYNKYKEDYTIKNVVCVGGGSRMPMIRQTIAECIPDCPCLLTDDPEFAVVKGAALYAEKLENAVPILDMVFEVPATEESGPAILTDIASFSYGIRCYENGNDEKQIIRNLIIKGDPLPAENPFTFCLHPNNIKYKKVQFDIYRSECENKNYDPNNPSAIEIGKLVLDLSKVEKLDQNQIEGTMRIDENQLLILTAVSNGTKKSITLERV